MGGRGSSSSEGGARNKRGSSVKLKNIKSMTNLILDTKLDAKTKQEVVNVLKDFQNEYGLVYNNTRIAQLTGKDKLDILAFYDGAGIVINSNYLNSDVMTNAMKKSAESGFHPPIGNKSGMEATVSHELGHAINGLAAEKMGTDLHSAAKTIVDRAIKETGHKRGLGLASAISGYAKFNDAETIAEAFSDVYCNGKKAAKESIAIKKIVDSYVK